MSRPVLILFLFFAGWNVNVMPGAPAANFDRETRKEDLVPLCAWSGQTGLEYFSGLYLVEGGMNSYLV